MVLYISLSMNLESLLSSCLLRSTIFLFLALCRLKKMILCLPCLFKISSILICCTWYRNYAFLRSPSSLITLFLTLASFLKASSLNFSAVQFADAKKNFVKFVLSLTSFRKGCLVAFSLAKLFSFSDASSLDISSMPYPPSSSGVVTISLLTLSGALAET